MDYLIGHLVGDYLLQNHWQATTKKLPGFQGIIACGVHSLLWTLAILLFTGWWSLKLAFLVFLSHYVIDRTYLVSWLVREVGQRKDFWLQVVWDNTIHLVFLWLIDKFVA